MKASTMELNGKQFKEIVLPGLVSVIYTIKSMSHRGGVKTAHCETKVINHTPACDVVNSYGIAFIALDVLNTYEQL